MKSPHRIHDTAPATRWEDAFLSGNGETGIMVFGDPHSERVIFNHHRLVLPNGTRDLLPPRVADRVERLRDLMLAGKVAQAQREINEGRELLWTQSFHPGYQLIIEGSTDGPIRDYVRETDFETGEVTVRWAGDAGEWVRRAFVSRADGVVVHRLSGPPSELRLRLSGDLPGCPAGVAYETAAGRHLVIRGRYSQGEGFSGVTLVSGASLDVDGKWLLARGSEVLLLSKVDRHLDAAALESALRELPASYDQLLARHKALHQPIYRRVSLDLDIDPAARALPTVELIAQQNADRGRIHPALLERMFHCGRYLLLSSSGVLPPRLTGLWLGAWGAAWAGDFTTDANLNLQMAAVNIGAMPELMDAYTALILGQVRDWQTNARETYGTRGILAPGRTDGEHGHLFHLDDDWPWTMWLAGADWLLYPMWEHYLVTGDAHFLRSKLLPWLIEAALFFEDFLTRVDSAGHVVFVPSYSPETGPAGAGTMGAINATMDIAAGKHALATAIEACSLMGVEDEAVNRWTALLDRLPPYKVDERGALAEWAWDGYPPNENHRHISHLYPVWPLHEINPVDTPSLAAAARRALELRGDENLSAHGSLHRALAAARLKDGELAYANLRKILGNDMVFRSLMTSHNPDLEIYNADAAHTIPGVLIEMLVDSRSGVVELLPALPSALPRGRINGVACRGRVVVDELGWDMAAGAVRVVLHSVEAQELTVVYGPATRRVDLLRERPVTIVFP